MSGPRQAAVALALAALIAVTWLVRDAGAPAPDPVVPPPSRGAAPRLPGGESAPPVPARDPFRYADQAPPATMTARVPAPVAAPAPATPAPVRLLGFVRRPGGLRAALGAAGEVWVVGVGETAAGYAVLEVDEENGVRLRGADGQELRLGPPS